jgi:hypothetical protein
MMSRTFALGAAFSVVLASAGLACSAASESLSFDGAPGSTDADAEAARAPNADQKPEFADSGAGAAAPPNTLESGILLVNATQEHSAFRVCPPSGAGRVSLSPMAPIPTALMPRSNVAGVDVGGAVALDPVPELAGLAEVLVIRVDATTKGKLGADVSCQKVACVQSGGECLGDTKVSRVRVLDPLGNPVSGAFSVPGRILALRDDSGKGLRFEAIAIESQALSGNKRMAVDYRNLSEFKGGVTFTAPNGKSIPIEQARSVIVDIGNDFTKETFTAGTYQASLFDIHQSSDPRVAIESFYASPGSFALILVGVATPPALEPERGLRFLAVPVTAPKRAPIPLPDAGGDATTDGEADAKTD